MTSRKFILAALAAFFALGAISYTVYPPAAGAGQLSSRYESATYGISFQYPSKYALASARIGPPEPPHERIELCDGSGCEITLDIVENEGRYATAADLYPDLPRYMRGWGEADRAVEDVIVRRGYLFIWSLPARSNDQRSLESIVETMRTSL